MFTVDLRPFAVNLATKFLLWQKSSPMIEYDCLEKSVHGSILIEFGFKPVALGADD